MLYFLKPKYSKYFLEPHIIYYYVFREPLPSRRYDVRGYEKSRKNGIQTFT